MDEKIPVIRVMVGNIGSGKSTWIRENKGNAIVISRDALRDMFGGGEYLYDEKFEPTVHQVEEHIVRILMHSQKDIIVDEVGISKKMRQKYFEMANTYGYDVVAVVMPDYSKEYCVQKRMEDALRGYTAEVWGQVWEKFNAVKEVPTLEEGFKDIIVVEQERKA